MASLFKRNGWYYLQFYSTKRSPKKKQVTLKSKSKRTAEKLQSRLQDEFRLGEYDPWKDDGSDDSTDLSRLEDAVDEKQSIQVARSDHSPSKETSIQCRLLNGIQPRSSL